MTTLHSVVEYIQEVRSRERVLRETDGLKYWNLVTREKTIIHLKFMAVAKYSLLAYSVWKMVLSQPSES